MLKSPPFPGLPVALIGLALLGLIGCDKKDGKPETAPAIPKTGTAAVAPVSMKSAEPTSFDEVATRLDRGGSLYFYLSTQQWLGVLSQQIASLKELALSASAGQQTPAQTEQITKAFTIVTDLVKKSGVEDITGLGLSSIALEPGVYRNKLFVHHATGKGGGFLTTAFGKTPHRLAALDFLPADTALASFADFDLAQIIGIVKQSVEQSGIPEAKAAVDQMVAQFPTMTGMPLDDVLTSLGGSGGIILTLDPTKPISLPIPGQPQTIPTPRLALVLQTKDDRIFKQIDKSMAANPGVIRVDEPELRMRTMPVPATPQFTARATAAQWGDRLIIASDDGLIRDMLAAQKDGHGYKSTPEFVRLAAGMPTEGNGFQLGTQAFADLLNRVQQEMMAHQPGMTPQQRAMFTKFFMGQKSGPSFAISAHLDNGWLSVGKSSTGAGQMIVPLLIVPAAVAAGVALPIVQKARSRAETTSDLSHAKQLAIACQMYAVDNDGKFPPTLETLIPNYLPDRSILVSKAAPSDPNGFIYTPGLTTSSPPATILIEGKVAPGSRERVVVHMDGSAVINPAP